MVILGINPSHNATACLLEDGEIKACISEERLTRVKNQSGFPKLAVRECLRVASKATHDIDYVVFSFKDPKVNAGFTPLAQESLKNDWVKNDLWTNAKRVAWIVKEQALSKIPQSRNIYDTVLPIFYSLFVHPKLQNEVVENVRKELGIAKEKILFADHHTTHSFSAYYSSPNYWKEPKLILTLDAMGDGLCSTVGIGKNGRIKTIAKTRAGNSIGDLYAFITAYLGMKMGEHEYKVMGLAPYAGGDYPKNAYNKLKRLIWVNDDLTFSTQYHSHIFYKLLPELLKGERFDNVSAAIQQLTEELLTTWVKKAVAKTGIKSVVCGGGLFMNVKTNQKIWELPSVKDLFVMPSCGDESTAIGAAYWGYERERTKDNSLPRISPLRDLYFGPQYSDKDIGGELKKKKYSKYKITRPKNLAASIARLLKKDQPVARFAGRMEWGARALGNRSILANPESLDVVRVINSQIKSRDFWMPFAPVIMKERESKYIVNPKRIRAPYMIVTFDSTRQGRTKFKAAMHQYDFTLRPQIIERDWNEDYWQICREFEKITGIGGVLNTSFNLHGFPIVCTPKDALDVFEKSGLKYLAIGSYLLSKE